MSERWLLAPAGGSRLRAVAVSVLMPVAALGLGLIVQPERELGAVSLFLLAVVAAAVVGGIWAGVGSSVLGFLALNYFFTEPLHTFRVNDRDDVVASSPSSSSPSLVGSVVARAVDERLRATRREREARLLNLFATKALSGEPLERVLNDLAAALSTRFAWRAASIEVRAAGRPYERPARVAPLDGRSPPSTLAITSGRACVRDPHRGARPSERGALRGGRAAARGGRRPDRRRSSSAPR